MTGISAAQTDKSDRFGRKFQRVLLIGSLCVLLAGIAGFGYLRAKSPLAVLTESDRTIAAASAFIPARSPFTFSLLTHPDRLIALQRATARPSQQSQIGSEIAQLQQNLLQATGIDYERDIQPWLGTEITFAYTALDLDLDSTNGSQPGYLLAFDIAPGAQQQAQAFLQLFWQQQLLQGNPAQGQQISGVSILSGKATGITTASALVGDQFVMFANDVRVLRRSIQSAQTAQNLAQTPAYRKRVAALSEPRIGLAYLDARLLNAEFNADSSSLAAEEPAFVAMSLAITQGGLMISTGADSAAVSDLSFSNANSLGDASLLEIAALKYLPAASEFALAGRSLSQLSKGRQLIGLSTNALPEFLNLPPFSGGKLLKESSVEGSKGAGDWRNTAYALARVGAGSGDDWILAVERGVPGSDVAKLEAEEQPRTLVERLDAAAIDAGYSAVPVMIDETEAVAWTRLKASGRRRQSGRRTGRQSGRQSDRQSGRRTGPGLETELLGLHLQRDETEIVASSLAAMETALAASRDSLLGSAQFIRATAAFSEPKEGYFFANWSAIASPVGQTFPLVGRLQVIAKPLVNHIDVVASAIDKDTVDVFIPLTESAAKQVSAVLYPAQS